MLGHVISESISLSGTSSHKLQNVVARSSARTRESVTALFSDTTEFPDHTGLSHLTVSQELSFYKFDLCIAFVPTNKSLMRNSLQAYGVM